MTIAPPSLHVGMEEVPFVTNPAVGARMRLLQVDARSEMSVMHGFMPAGLAVSTHRHRGPVQMWTMSGAWRYLEHEFVNRAGSYLYEPAGSVHSLYVPADNTEATEALSIVYGDVEYIDPDGNVVRVSNWKTTLANYYEGCEIAGIPRPNGLLR